MTTQQLLELDCRDPANQVKIQKALRRMGPLADTPQGEDVPQEMLERCLKKMCSKYNLFIRSLFPDMAAGAKDIVWRAETINLVTMEVYPYVFGRNLYEVLAKATIQLYTKTRKR